MSEEPNPNEQTEGVWERHARRWADLVREHPLQYLFLEVTRRCNLSCAYCGSDCSMTVRREELRVDQWISIMRQIAEDFAPPKVMVAVTGGEPLLKPGVFDLFRALRDLKFPYGIVTNGFLLDERVAAELVEAKIGSISISMDATAEINDALRGRGAAQKVELAIRNLMAAGFAGKLEIISTITRPVVALLEPMRRRVAELRVPYWRIAPVMPIGRAAQRPDLIPGPVEIRQMLEFVKQAREDQLLPKPEFCEEGFLGNRFEGVVRPFLSQCRAGVTTAGILCDGRIGACPELGEAFVQGHIQEERFKQVWDTRYESLRNREWTRKGRCASCDHYGRCQGGSLHLYPSQQGDLLRCLYWMAKDAEGEVAGNVP